MLLLVSSVKLVAEIALLALAGQFLLGLMAGQKRETNFFYKLLQLLAKPFTRAVRLITPRQVADHQVPIVTFCLLLVIYAVVTFEKINLCLHAGMVGCR